MTREIHVVSSMATRALLAELVDAWHARGGAPVRVESVGGVDAARRVAAGEPFDVVVLASDAIGRLAEGGHVVAGSCTDVVQCEVAIAVPQGAPRPALGDEGALRTAVLEAGRIVFSTGPSGTALQQLFARWGVLDTLRDRLVQAPPGVPVARLLAQGDADLGFQQLSEFVGMPSIEVLGTMPPGLEIITTFSVARCRGGGHADGDDVLAWLHFLHSSATDDAKRRHGMTPVHA